MGDHSRPGPLVIEPDFTRPPPVLAPVGNPDGFRVPPTWIDPTAGAEVTNRRIAALKTDEYYWSRMRWWDRQFKNPQYLSTLTLGELGSLIEFSVHNDMHMRWASTPRDPATGEPVPEGRKDADISTKWDDQLYDFLGDFYSSHVNPIFWRLHGWVDDRITDWFHAHEAAHPGEVQQGSVQGIPWFKPGQWVLVVDPWAGPHESGHDHAGQDHPGPHYDIKKMERVLAILFGPPPDVPAAFAERFAMGLTVRRPHRRHLTWFLD